MEIINSELIREFVEDKKGILDVRVKTRLGKQIDIEIQILPTKAEGVVIGEAKAKAETICEYLEDRFGAESQALQETVKTITDLNALGRISKKIFFITQLDEATALIQDNAVSQ